MQRKEQIELEQGVVACRGGSKQRSGVEEGVDRARAGSGCMQRREQIESREQLHVEEEVDREQRMVARRGSSGQIESREWLHVEEGVDREQGVFACRGGKDCEGE